MLCHIAHHEHELNDTTQPERRQALTQASIQWPCRAVAPAPCPCPCGGVKLKVLVAAAVITLEDKSHSADDILGKPIGNTVSVVSAVAMPATERVVAAMPAEPVETTGSDAQTECVVAAMPSASSL